MACNCFLNRNNRKNLTNRVMISIAISKGTYRYCPLFPTGKIMFKTLGYVPSIGRRRDAKKCRCHNQISFKPSSDDDHNTLPLKCPSRRSAPICLSELISAKAFLRWQRTRTSVNEPANNWVRCASSGFFHFKSGYQILINISTNKEKATAQPPFPFCRNELLLYNVPVDTHAW